MLFSSFFVMAENVTKGRAGLRAWASLAQCKDTVQLPHGSYLSSFWKLTPFWAKNMG